VQPFQILIFTLREVEGEGEEEQCPSLAKD